MYCTYILRSLKSGRFYIGSTDDLPRRLHDHNSGNTRSTKAYRPWFIVYSETFYTAREALARERQIKRWKNPLYMCKVLGLDPK